MAAILKQKEPERRKERSFDEHFDNLSSIQVAQVYSLVKLGYSLAFVRIGPSGKRLAVLNLGESLATIDFQGDVNFTPDIILRN